MRDHAGARSGHGAALFGFTELYGSVPGGQAEYLRVPQAQFGPILVPEGVADERFLYLSDILPTAWQGVEYADVPNGGSLAVIGLGPVGLMAVAIATHRGLQVIGVDNVPERLARARQYGATVINTDETDDVPGAIRELTDGAGADLIGGWFGTGDDRGIALVFTLAGVAGVVVTILAFKSRYYRDLSSVYAGGVKDRPDAEAA